MSQPLVDFHGRDHLAATAIVGHGVDPQALLADALPLGHVALLVAAEIHHNSAVTLGRRGKLRIVAEELVHPGDDHHAALQGIEDEGPPVRWQAAAGRGNADQKRVRPRRLAQRRNDRDAAAHAQKFLARLAGGTAIPHGHHVRRPITDHANGRLRRVRIGVPVDQDHHLAVRAHGVSLAGPRLPFKSSAKAQKRVHAKAQ